MTATNLKRKTERRKTLDMKQMRKHKWHFQGAWMHIEKIKGHLDSMTKERDRPQQTHPLRDNRLG